MRPIRDEPRCALSAKLSIGRADVEHVVRNAMLLLCTSRRCVQRKLRMSMLLLGCAHKLISALPAGSYVHRCMDIDRSVHPARQLNWHLALVLAANGTDAPPAISYNSRARKQKKSGNVDSLVTWFSTRDMLAPHGIPWNMPVSPYTKEYARLHGLG